MPRIIASQRRRFSAHGSLTLTPPCTRLYFNLIESFTLDIIWLTMRTRRAFYTNVKQCQASRLVRSRERSPADEGGHLNHSDDTAAR